jgi:hypothetical protein
MNSHPFHPRGASLSCLFPVSHRQKYLLVNIEHHGFTEPFGSPKKEGLFIGQILLSPDSAYLPKEDAPLPLTFGDGDTVVELVKLMGTREGIGDLLAEGSYRLAEHYGHPELSMSVKKQEIPMRYLIIGGSIS